MLRRMFSCSERVLEANADGEERRGVVFQTLTLLGEFAISDEENISNTNALMIRVSLEFCSPIFVSF